MNFVENFNMGCVNLLFAVACVLALSGTTLAAPSSKIEAKLQKSFGTQDTAAVFINMKEGTEDLLHFVSSKMFNSREERINAVVSALKIHAGSTQKSVKKFLDGEKIHYESFWISNQIYIPEASLSLVQQLAEFQTISEIIEEGFSHIEEPIISSIVTLPPGVSPADTQWGISKIGADRVWESMGLTGVGVVVGIIDTGVRGTHQDLTINYRTPYGWMDPTFRNIRAKPDDGSGHGTHCLGTIVGSNGIGVAPGAKWVACKGCPNGFCFDHQLIFCGQWMACPTLPDGTLEDCSQAPHLVSSSWAGGRGTTFYNPVINAWKAANIIPIFALGNSGPKCETASSPADSDVIGVGATSLDDDLAPFSSKGPSAYGTLKPDISAPGVEIYSSYNSAENSYATLSGTSMATPHVAGAVALILSKRGNMTYEQVKEVLFNGVDTEPLVQCTDTCGGIEGSVYPNNCYGRGRLNVYNSIVKMQ